MRSWVCLLPPSVLLRGRVLDELSNSDSLALGGGSPSGAV